MKQEEEQVSAAEAGKRGLVSLPAVSWGIIRPMRD